MSGIACYNTGVIIHSMSVLLNMPSVPALMLYLGLSLLHVLYVSPFVARHLQLLPATLCAHFR